MLIEFSVENFLSFRDKVTLSMVASSDDELEASLIKGEDKDFRLSKAAVVYGANGSGKSNLIKAMLFMQKYVLTSMMDIEKTELRVVPFKLDLGREEEPTEFEINFIDKGVKYSYGFALNRWFITREWLYSYPKTQKRLLFTRDCDDISGEYDYVFGGHWEGEKRKLTPLVREDSLFISVAASLNNPLAKVVLDFFRRMNIVTTNQLRKDILGISTRGLIHNNKRLTNQVLSFLKTADLGIKGIKLKETPVGELLGRYLEVPLSQQEAIKKDGLKEPINDKTVEVLTLHDAVDKEGKATEVLFSLKEESDGTQKIFALSASITGALLTGSILVIDELDAQVHPLITRALIKLFQSEQNSENAQLIITTHDSSLLDQETLRRDQIWFTEKDEYSSSQLYSLFEFKPRKGENFRRGYLDGRYGGIPFLTSNFSFHQEQDHQEETEGKSDEQKEQN